MTQKIQRVVNEIERTSAKIAELQARLPVLEKQKTELENIEIITVVRSANVPPEGLAEFVRAYKAQLTKKAEPEPKTEAAETDAHASSDMASMGGETGESIIENE